MPLADTLDIKEAKSSRATQTLHASCWLGDGVVTRLLQMPDMPFDFHEQHGYDLHIALEVNAPLISQVMAKLKVQGIETHGVSDYCFIESIYFRDPNGYGLKLCGRRAGHDAASSFARIGRAFECVRCPRTWDFRRVSFWAMLVQTKERAMRSRALFLSVTIGAVFNASAAPRQNDVLPPGGFVASCAAGTAGSNIQAYGGYLAGNWSNSAYDGKYECSAQEFSGAAGSGSTSASFAAPNIANSATGQASMGLVRLAATNSSPGNTFSAQGAANGGWSDRTTVAIDGLSGSAVWLFDVAITGNLHTVGGSASFGATGYKNEIELNRSVNGFDPGGSDTFSTDVQRVRWRTTAASATAEESRTVSEVVTFAVPVTLGTPFVWGVYGSVFAGQRAATTGETRIVTAEVDFTQTMRYAGSHGVLVGDVLHNNYTLASDSGIDWLQVTAVPEPASAALLLAGAGLVGWVARRRRMR